MQTNESANREYRYQRFSEMPERGATTVFDNCFFEGVDLKPAEGDVYERCNLVGGSLTLVPGDYHLGDFVLENSRLITQDKAEQGGDPVVIRKALVNLVINERPVVLQLYNVDVARALKVA